MYFLYFDENWIEQLGRSSENNQSEKPTSCVGLISQGPLKKWTEHYPILFFESTYNLQCLRAKCFVLFLIWPWQKEICKLSVYSLGLEIWPLFFKFNFGLMGLPLQCKNDNDFTFDRPGKIFCLSFTKIKWVNIKLLRVRSSSLSYNSQNQMSCPYLKTSLVK